MFGGAMTCQCHTLQAQLESVRNELAKQAQELEALNQELSIERVGRLIKERRAKPRTDNSWSGQHARLTNQSKEP